MAADPIKIEGLRELQASLRRMDGQSQKKLRLVLNKAADIVISEARPRVPVRSGRAAGSLKASSSQREARVKGGGAKAPYYPWLDFGGRVGRRNSVSRPFFRKGRYIYAAYDAKRGAIEKEIQTGIVKLAEEAGFEVS